MTSPGPPRIGISRCLLGDEVRYDGGHKRDAFLVGTFGRFVEWVPVCPEVEIGMGTPREPIHLVPASDGVPAGPHRVRLVAVRSGEDWTDRMTAFAERRVRALARMDLSGYVLKKDSPSCGMERVRVHGASRTGRGLFAEALIRALPVLPVEEEGRLHDPALRENFVERVFAFQRLTGLFGSRWSRGTLVRFHTAHKLQLLVHSRLGYARLGRLVASASSTPRAALAVEYQRVFMDTLSRPTTPGRHADVMMHMVGHLKGKIDADDRDELLSTIEDHRRGIVPLVVPLTLIRHHVRRHDVAYLRDQTYIDWDPRELWLKNHS